MNLYLKELGLILALLLGSYVTDIYIYESDILEATRIE